MATGVILGLYMFVSGLSLTASATENCTNAGGRVENLTINETGFYDQDETEAVLSDNVVVSSRIFELLFKKQDQELALIPGGNIFGVKLKQKNVSVVESKGIPALSSGDLILSINGKQISTVEQAQKIIEQSGSESVTIRALHNGEEIGIEVKPRFENGEYKLGVSLRDGAMGIGTITFINPQTGAFGGLGHGICDSESGEIVQMETGVVSGALLGGIHKGEVGKPGELTGILTDEIDGVITSNNECGVFGVLNKLPSGINTVTVGSRDDVHEGEATIISTLKNGKSSEYKIEILDIDRSSGGSKSFRIRVTDETLKALSGGIVRGMSGSPIIQNGKLVGAVTHVLVANPTEGYGIFIENMLNAAEGRVQPKAA